MQPEEVYFLANRRDPSTIMDDEGVILQFYNSGGGIEIQPDGTKVRSNNQIWIARVLANDTKMLKRIEDYREKYPNIAKTFRQVTHIPKTVGKGNIKVGVMSSVKNEEVRAEAEKEAKKKYDQKLEQYRKFYQLESKLLNKDGSFKKNIPEDEKVEYERLKQELEIN